LQGGGYSKNPKTANNNDKKNLEGLDYAFFPIYPLLISIVNAPIKNIEISAFILSNILLLLNFTSLYLVIKRLISERIALRASILLFTFPFSIFYRSYFAEGLFFLVLVWFSYFFCKSRYILAGFLIGIINWVKGNAILINAVFLYYIYEYLKNLAGRKKLRYLIPIFFILAPLFLWILYVYIQTGNPLYFINVRNQWVTNELPLIRFFQNIMTILSFSNLNIHAFHSSKIDALNAVVVLALLILSRNGLPKKLWWISFSLWLTPLMFSDLISFSRHQTVSFPIFIYLSQVLNGLSYKIVLGLFIVGLFIISLFFVNWYWIG